MQEIKSVQQAIKEKQVENTQILRALEHNSKVHKAELDKVNNKLTHMEGDIKNIKDDNKRTNNIANLALTNAAQNRLDIATLHNN